MDRASPTPTHPNSSGAGDNRARACVWNFRLKKSVAMNLFRFDRFLPIHHDVDLARVGAKRANRQIVAHSMRSENAERIGMRAGKKTIQLIRRQPGDGE